MNDNIPFDDKFSFFLANPTYAKFIYFAALDEVKDALEESSRNQAGTIKNTELLISKMVELAKISGNKAI